MAELVRVLVIEDDQDINNLLKTYLEAEGYCVDQVFQGTEALLYLDRPYQLIMMDLMLPGLPGDLLISKIRERTEAPVIVVSGKAAVADKVELLRSGADDYVTKPFSHEELMARVNAQIRRQQGREEKEKQDLVYQDLRLSRLGREVSYAGVPVDLTQTEFQILEILMTEVGRVYSRNEIYERIWNGLYASDDNAINVHISHLRQKLKRLSGENMIETIWGIGYKLGRRS